MESLWPDVRNTQKLEENHSVAILRSQARAIEKDTEGVIKATFSKVTYSSNPMKTAKEIGQFITSLSSPGQELIDEELKDKKDINVLFNTTEYKFEIFNDYYRFRLFKLLYSEVFPISLEVDGGILEDIEYRNRDLINSNEELETILRDIFSSRKVMSVISKMLEVSQKDTQE